MISAALSIVFLVFVVCIVCKLMRKGELAVETSEGHAPPAEIETQGLGEPSGQDHNDGVRGHGKLSLPFPSLELPHPNAAEFEILANETAV